MIVAGIHDTDRDGDYRSLHPFLKSNSLDHNYFDCDNDRELAYANHCEDYNWIHADQSSNIVSPPSLSQKQVHQSSNIISYLSLPPKQVQIQVHILVRVLDCGMLRVECNIRAYNIVCGIIKLIYVPSVLLFPVIDPAFGITIVCPKSTLHLVKLSKKNYLYCIQKKNSYSFYVSFIHIFVT